MQSVHYSGTGFYAYTRDPKYVDQECSDAGVSRSQEEPFVPKDYKTPVNVYYFQGAHDGATIARGALVNWQNVPQGKSFFLMAEKGGHNPNLTRLESEEASIKLNENALFAHAIHGDDIAQLDLVAINQAQAPDQAWELYLSPTEATTIADKFEGISRWHY